MSKILEPLKLLLSRRPSAIAASSLVGTTLSKPDADVTSATASEDAVAGKESAAAFLETEYGMRIDVLDADSGNLQITDTSSKDGQQNGSTRQRRYRLFPDWQTSFLWSDDTSKKAAANGHFETGEEEEDEDDDESPEVDDDVIEARFPRLWAYYDVWRQTYETAFKGQGCHLVTGAEAFPNAADRIAWDAEGMLMACWLALREDVESVEYLPRANQYRVEKASIEKQLPQFLNGIWGEGAFVEFK